MHSDCDPIVMANPRLQDARQLISVVDKDGNGEMGFEEFKELLEEIMD